jgi:hypothetical protein
MVDGVGQTAYIYALGGELFTEDGPFANDLVTNTYFNRLRVGLGLAQPTGAWTNGFIHDAAGRLTNVISPAGSFACFYPPGMQQLVGGIALPNGSSVPRSIGQWDRKFSTRNASRITFHN